MVVVVVELGDFRDAAKLGVPVVHVQTLALESVLLHALVVIGADCVQVRALGQLLQLLGCLVETEDLFDAVVVLAYVVPVVKYAQSPVDLVLEAVIHFINYN